MKDKRALNKLTATFLRAFSDEPGKKVDLSNLRKLFFAEGLIVKNCGHVELYNLDTFIEPREKLLNDGTLVDFREEELFEKTEIFGNIAHRFSLYQKSGVLSGVAFETKGMKSLQFVKTKDGWKISSVAWDDEREGLRIPAKYRDGF